MARSSSARPAACHRSNRRASRVRAARQRRRLPTSKRSPSDRHVPTEIAMRKQIPLVLIAVWATVLALAAGVGLLGHANGAARDAAAAASCNGFAARAGKLFDNGDTAVLTGTFVPGNHVHLAI